MPPKTRASKVEKTLKENFNVTNKSNPRKQNKVTKQPRKAFADKTNSPPDEIATVQPCVKHVKNTQTSDDIQQFSHQRSRRVRRLPNRFEENNVLKKLSNSSFVSPEKVKTVGIAKVTPIKTVSSYPTESHLKVIVSPMINVRSKRIQRLPSKANDHTLSPIKPVQASTPIATLPLQKRKNVNEQIEQKNEKKLKETKKNKQVQVKDGTIKGSLKHIRSVNQGRKPLNNESLSSSINNSGGKSGQTSIDSISKSKNENLSKPIKKTNQNKKTQSKIGMVEESLKNISDTNNNDGCKHLNNDLSISKTNSVVKSSEQKIHTKISKQQSSNNSLRLLEDKKPSKRKSSKLDVYDFTFDPDEEPPPAKKKKKRVTKKNPSQTKKVTIKSTYDKNLAKVLAALKNSVAVKSSQSTNPNPTKKNVITQQCVNKNVIKEKLSPIQPISKISNDRQHSMRVEDIALQFQEDDHPINYSPVYSPVNSPVYSPVNSPVHCPDARDPPPYINREEVNVPTNKDPLNLLDDISDFDEHPVASSSMNCSTRHPLASPWRVEFGNLPIKWPVNAYVKPNMTPAIETSFIDFGENKKKHIYTDMVPETTDMLPTVVKNAPNLKQTSIISFIKEVIDKKSNKNKKNKIVSNNSLFEDTTHTLPPHVTPKKHNSLNEMSPIKETAFENVHNENVLTEQHKLNTPIKNKEIHSSSATKVLKKKKDKNVTYFGFDESEDQENVSPVKENNKIRSLRPRSRAVLQEINAVKCPQKAAVLIAAISKPSPSGADKIFNEIKTPTEPPVHTEEYLDGKKSDATANESPESDKEVTQSEMECEDSQSVHLFEDVELIHHSKPVRKSYGKSKKVTFRHNSNSSDSDVESNKSSDDDNLEDLSFKIPSIKEKKVTKKKKPKKLMSKKEEKAAEAWAKGFNSMCEDIEEYDLVVE